MEEAVTASVWRSRSSETPMETPMERTPTMSILQHQHLLTTTTINTTAILNPRLDSRIWSKLPLRLIERVLAFLPPPPFFRFRCVCKHFYNLLFSDSFLEISATISPTRHCFLFVTTTTNKAFVFDPSTFTWFYLPLPFIPPRFTLAASSGGLLCFTPQDPGHKTLLLCNPLTKTLNPLHQTLTQRFVPSIGLLVQKHPPSFQVVVAGDDLISPFAVKNLTAEWFDSRCPVWTPTGQLPRLCSFDSGKMVFCDGFFYCMNYSPFSVLAYEVGVGVWSKIQAPMRRFLRSPSLVECRGRLVLVSAVEKSKLNVPRSIRMWGLQERGWVEVERMPHQIYLQLFGGGGGGGVDHGFVCVGHGDFILISLNNSSSSEILMFDFYQKAWSWIPRCPFLADGSGMVGFAYEPRLAASPALALLEPSFFTFGSPG